MKKYMKITKIVLFFTTLTIFIACKNDVKSQDFTLKGAVFGTTYKITYLNAKSNYQKSIKRELTAKPSQMVLNNMALLLIESLRLNN